MTRRQLLDFAIVSAIWGCTWYVVRDQLQHGVPGLWGVSYRFLVAGALLLVLSRATGRPLAIGGDAHRFAALLGLLQFTGNYAAVYEAEHYVASGLVAVGFALLVAPNAIFARLFYGMRIEPRVIIGALIGLPGVALLFAQEFGAGASPDATRGAVLTLIAVLFCSVANVINASPVARRSPPWATLGWAMLYGAAITAVLAFATAGPPVFPASPRFWGGLVFLAAIGSSFAFILYYNLIREIGPGKAAYTGLVTPVIAIALSTLLEGYRWTPEAAAGAALAFAGVVVALVRPGRAAARAPA